MKLHLFHKYTKELSKMNGFIVDNPDNKYRVMFVEFGGSETEKRVRRVMECNCGKRKITYNYN